LNAVARTPILRPVLNREESMGTVTNQPNALRRALFLDAAASGGMGVVLLVAAGPLAGLLGLPPSLLRSVGVFLVPFAAMLLWVARRRDALPGITRAIVVGNVLWVVASGLLLVSGVVTPTLLGEIFVLAQAAAVLIFAYLEYRGLRSAQGTLAAERA
jgi:hypothetical protein